MNELKPSTRALLDLGRLGDDPTDAAIGRNRRALAKKLGVATLGATALVGATSTEAAAVGAWTTAKVILLCGAVAVGGAAAWGVVHQRGAGPPVGDGAAAPAAPAPPEPAKPMAATPAMAETPAAPEVAPAVSGSSPAARPAPSAQLSPAPSIKQELDLVRAAQQHLNRGEPQAAMASLAEHAQKFPSGVLSEERDALRVFALCRMGNVAGARSLADEFVRRAPASPFVDRVRAACREPAARTSR